MGVSKAYTWSCADCAHLDKSRKKWDERHYCYLVGCNKRKGGYVCGWCREDKGLKTQGCSDYQEPKSQEPKEAEPMRPQYVQISIFD